MNLKKANLYKKILKSKNFSLFFKTIRILYIIKIHPEYSIKTKLSFIIIIKKIFSRIYLLIKHKLLNFLYKNKNHFKEKRVLIVSHLVNDSHINKEDFYFKNLEKVLKSKKISYQFLLINHTKLNSSLLNKKNKNKNVWILENYLNLKDETLIFLKQLKELIKIYLNLFNFGKKITNELTLSLFNNETKHAIRVHLILKKILKIINPKVFITTFEGFPWERASFKTVKNYNIKIKNIGYQNVLLTKNYKSIFFKLSNEYDPDCIWLTGTGPKKLFQRSELKKKELKIVGKLNFISNIPQKKKIRSKTGNTCLVIPEGIYSECKRLFQFSYYSALNDSSNFYIWRLHPVINKQNVLKMLKIGNEENLPSNISFSKEKNIKSDFLKSDFVLYRGSNAIISAIKYGLKPIYLEIKNEPNIDLFSLYKKTINYVNKPEQLSNIMNKKSKLFLKRKKILRFIKENEYKINEREIVKSLKV